MAGFGAIGEWAIGEDQNDGAWSQPASLVAEASLYAPSFVSGTIFPETLLVSVAPYAPQVGAGARTAPGSTAAQGLLVAPQVSAGASVLVDTTSAEGSLFAPAENAGAATRPGTLAAEGHLPSPDTEGGARVSPESLSAQAHVYPYETVSVGAIISPVVVQVFEETGGGIGEGAIGEYAIGEGPGTEQICITNSRSSARLFAPRTSAGASVIAPTLTVEGHLFNPEVDARSRRNRMFAIAS